MGRGTGLVGGTIKSKLTREDLERVLLDGFFPAVASTDMPQARRRVGLQEIGLPYATDAAITRHLAKFLRQQGAEFAAPTHVLFNGGVFKADDGRTIAFRCEDGGEATHLFRGNAPASSYRRIDPGEKRSVQIGLLLFALVASLVAIVVDLKRRRLRNELTDVIARSLLPRTWKPGESAVTASVPLTMSWTKSKNAMVMPTVVRSNAPTPRAWLRATATPPLTANPT